MDSGSTILTKGLLARPSSLTMTFTYRGEQAFVVHKSVGRIPGETAKGHWWQDYHGNRNIFIRAIPGKKGKFQLKIFVNGTVTTDEEMTKRLIQSYVVNHFGFQILDSHFAVM
jgi:hypothetical protein